MEAWDNLLQDQPPSGTPEADLSSGRGGGKGSDQGPVARQEASLDHAKAYAQLWLGVGIMIALTIVAGLLLMRYRRGVLGASADPESGEGIMQMLRRARDRGEMTEEEYQAARRKLVGEMAARMGSGREGSGGPGERRPRA